MTGFSLSETASRMTSMLSASRRCRCVKLVTKLPRFPRLRAEHSPRLCITRGLIVSLEIAPGGPPEARIHRCGRRLSCGVAEASRAGHQPAAHVRYAARAESAADRGPEGDRAGRGGCRSRDTCNVLQCQGMRGVSSA